MQQTSVKVPIINAEAPRDYTEDLYSLPRWAVYQILGYVTMLQQKELWSGDIEDVIEAGYDVGDVIDLLGMPVDLSVYLQDVRLNADGSLEKSYDGATWLPAGSVSVIDSANAVSLPAGSSATAGIVGTTLELGIPIGDTGATGATGATGQAGQSVTDLIATTLPAGSSATASYNAITGVGTLGIPQGADGQSGDCADCPDPANPAISDQFTTDGKDRWCYAAGKLTDVTADRFEDYLQLFDAASTFVIENTEQIIEFAADLVSAGFASIVVEPITNFFSEGVAQPAVDYIRQQAQDLEVKAELQELYYCAISNAVINDDIANLPDYILDEINPIYQINIVQVVLGIFDATNFGDAITVLFNSFTARGQAEFMASFYLIHKETWGVMGLSEPIQQTVQQSMGLAQYFDARECSGFACQGDGCYTLDFLNMPSLPSQISFVNNLGTYQQGVGVHFDLQYVPAVGNYASRVNMRFTGAPAEAVLTSVRWLTTHSGIISQSRQMDLNSWTNGTTVIGTPITAPDTSSDDYLLDSPVTIQQPDFTTIILFGYDTAAGITNQNFIIRQMEICGNAELIAWLESIDTLA